MFNIAWSVYFQSMDREEIRTAFFNSSLVITSTSISESTYREEKEITSFVFLLHSICHFTVMSHFSVDPLRILISSGHLSFHPSRPPPLDFLFIISEASLFRDSTDYSDFLLPTEAEALILYS